MTELVNIELIDTRNRSNISNLTHLPLKHEDKISNYLIEEIEIVKLRGIMSLQKYPLFIRITLIIDVFSILISTYLVVDVVTDIVNILSFIIFFLKWILLLINATSSILLLNKLYSLNKGGNNSDEVIKFMRSTYLKRFVTWLFMFGLFVYFINIIKQLKALKSIYMIYNLATQYLIYSFSRFFYLVIFKIREYEKRNNLIE